MKIRTSFVSNSSSSSFIVSTDNPDKKVMATITADLSSLVRLKISTEQELLEFFGYYWGYADKMFAEGARESGQFDSAYEEWDLCLAEIKAGKTLLQLRCSNEDDNAVSLVLYNDLRLAETLQGVKFVWGEM